MQSATRNPPVRAENKLRHILLDEFEIGIAPEVIDVRNASGDKIIDRDHAMPALDEQINQVRPEEARPARDHRCRPWLGCFAARSFLRHARLNTRWHDAHQCRSCEHSADRI
jgi:hypothetical protein